MSKYNSVFLILFVFLSACASSPQLYPNSKLKKVGKEHANQDIAECQELASEYMSSGKGKDIAQGAGKGAMVGAATGAVFGALTGGGVARGALFGGGVGAAGGAASAAASPDQVKRNFVNQCLHDRGYQVMGWK